MIKMSRSYRKHCIIKCAGDTSNKKLFNRRLRRCNKFQDIPSGKAYRKCNESWDIYDYISRYSYNVFKKYNLESFDSEKDCYKYWKKYYRSK